MKTQRYNLLTALIVSALHPNEPQAPGTKWEPTNAIDVQEANELTLAGYAEKIEAKASDKITPTWLQRQDEARRKAAVEAEVADVPRVDPNANDGQGDGGGFSDEELKLILAGSVEQIKAELEGLTADQLLRLAELEGDAEQDGKQRVTAIQAIEAAYAAKTAEEEQE
jgi:hypothetical protein